MRVSINQSLILYMSHKRSSHEKNTYSTTITIVANKTRTITSMELVTSYLILFVISSFGTTISNQVRVANMIPDGTFPQMSHPVDTDMVVRLPPYAHVRYTVPEHFKKRSAKILFWSSIYSDPSHWSWWFSQEQIKDTCPDIDCEFTTDRSQVDSSDALMFQVFGEHNFRADVNETEFRSQLPERRLPHQRYVFFDSESPERDRDRDMSRLNGLFNWTMTYRRDSDVFAHFGRTVLTKQPPYQAGPDLTRNYADGKRKLIAWFVSHCTTKGRREKFVEELQRYVPVDIYGGCGNLTCNPPRSEECLNKLATEYKFYLSFENALCRDYVTEKFGHLLPHKVVPIVFGGIDYSLLAPPGSYIDALAFEGGPRHLAEYLLKLDADDEEYNRFYDWRRGYDAVAIHNPMWVCELCIKLMDPDEPDKVYDDFVEWWNHESVCHHWEPHPNSKK